MDYQPIKLIRKSYTTDDYGQQIPTETSREVFAKVESVGMNEFFTANQLGFRPDLRLTFVQEYNGEELAEVNGVRYEIYRTYQKLEDYVELYLKVIVGESQT